MSLSALMAVDTTPGGAGACESAGFASISSGTTNRTIASTAPAMNAGKTNDRVGEINHDNSRRRRETDGKCAAASENRRHD
jgi:hypothetical protein